MAEEIVVLKETLEEAAAQAGRDERQRAEALRQVGQGFVFQATRWGIEQVNAIRASLTDEDCVTLVDAAIAAATAALRWRDPRWLPIGLAYLAVEHGRLDQDESIGVGALLAHSALRIEHPLKEGLWHVRPIADPEGEVWLALEGFGRATAIPLARYGWQMTGLDTGVFGYARLRS